jgi:bacterioferritin
VLKNELTAINLLKNWGVTKLGTHEYDESIDEMKHADMVIERLLFLDGLPRLELGKLLIGESVPEILERDLSLEQEAIPQLREAIAHCNSVCDFVTRDLFVAILTSEEAHVDFLETQLGLLAKIGPENYIQLQSGPAS